MNKQLLIGLVICIILIIAGGGIYAAMHSSSNTSAKKTPVMAQPKPTVSTVKMTQGTLKSLLSLGSPQQCTYSTDISSRSVNGTVYVAKGKMRGNFVSTSGDNKVNGHMILDNGYTYIWTDMSNRGIKMAMNQMQPSVTPANSNTQSVDLNQSVSYTCQGWTEDDSQFTPPTNITFSTFAIPSGVMQSGSVTTSPGANQSACSACNNIPAGPGRTACLTQLHCQ